MLERVTKLTVRFDLPFYTSDHEDSIAPITTAEDIWRKDYPQSFIWVGIKYKFQEKEARRFQGVIFFSAVWVQQGMTPIMSQKFLRIKFFISLFCSLVRGVWCVGSEIFDKAAAPRAFVLPCLRHR